jgi:hypothetical protein
LGGKTTDSNLRAECGDCNESNGNGLATVGNLMPDYSQISRDCENSGMQKVRQSAGLFFSLRESAEIFEQTYFVYPVHIAKNAAHREWRNAVVRWALEEHITFGDSATRILAQVHMYAISDSAKADGIRKGWRPPYLSTWLKNGQFTDDPKEWQAHERKQERELDRTAEKVAEKFSFTPPNLRSL